MFSQRIACSVQILDIHLCLFHVRNEDVFTDPHLPCPISVFPCWSEGRKKSRMNLTCVKWSVFQYSWLVPTFCPFAFLCSSASSACVGSLGSGRGILSSSFRFHWPLHGPFTSIRSCILSCVWNRNKTPVLGGVQRKMMGTQMAASIMTVLLFKASASSEKCGFRILYSISPGGR